jgi:hypothetical protein
MLLALLLLASAPDWVPARWKSGDPKSLELIAQTPINCLLVERSNWAAAFNKRDWLTLSADRVERHRRGGQHYVQLYITEWRLGPQTSQ